jgi:hypothetical protein
VKSQYYCIQVRKQLFSNGPIGRLYLLDVG